MPIYDLTDQQLDALRGPVDTDPDDFDRFWSTTLGQAAEHELDVRLTPVDSGLTTVRAFDLSFRGWNGDPVHGWLLQPTREQDRNEVGVVEYVGYGGGRGLPHEWLTWPSAGYTYLVVDARGQGSGYRTGDTPDLGHHGAPHAPGFLTQGVESPETYYYRRLFVDSVRAVEAIRQVPGVDPTRVAVTGTSQGGGLAIAAAALAEDIWALITAVPFLCSFRRGAELAAQGPFTELAGYCAQRPEAVDQVFATLAYFDGVNMARRCTVPALWSIALMDEVVPPSTMVAAHAAYGGDAQLIVHPFAGHEDARGRQARDGLEFLDKLRRSESTPGKASR